MNPAADLINSVFGIGAEAIRRIWPDPIRRAEEMRKLEELKQKGDLARLDAQVQLLLAQIKVNEEQAKHKSLYVAGARPFIIWVGGFSMAWAGLIHPLLMWVWAFAGIEGEPPPMIDPQWILGLLASLLGVAGMRSYDKQKGTQTDALG